jgi:hypothetical protein
VRKWGIQQLEDEAQKHKLVLQQNFPAVSKLSTNTHTTH